MNQQAKHGLELQQFDVRCWHGNINRGNWPKNMRSHLHQLPQGHNLDQLHKVADLEPGVSDKGV